MRVVYVAKAKEQVMTEISLEGLDKAAVLAALFNSSKPQGIGFMPFDSTPMSVEEARELLEHQQYFDYLQGRIMKVDLSGDTLETGSYDLDNGDNAAQNAIDSLRDTNDPNNIAIRAQHASATAESVKVTRESLTKAVTSVEQIGDLTVTHIGMDDVADIIAPAIDKAEKSIKSPLD